MENLSGSAQRPGRPEAAAEADSVPQAHISEADRQHLEAFPRERKLTLLQRILARDPDKSMRLSGRLDFKRSLQRLRRDGYALIDLQPRKNTLSSVWYRKSDGVLDWRRTEVSMVVWEPRETTVQTWLL